MKKLGLLFAICFSATLLFGQISIDWQQCYGSLDYDGGYGIQPFGDGYRVLGVASERNGMCQCGDFHGVWLFDMTPDLSITRQRCWDYSTPAQLVKNDAGEIFQVSEQHGPNIWLSVSKLDDEGYDTWWTSFEANFEYSSPFAYATATSDGGVAAATTISDEGGHVTTYFGGNDCWVVRLDAEGNLLWERTLGTLGDETLNCLVNASDGGLLVGVYLAQITAGNIGCGNLDNRNVLVKLDNNGNIEWNRCFPVSFNDVIEYDDGYLLAGSRGDAYGTQDCALLRCDAYGNILWTKSYGGSGNESIIKVFEDGPEGYTVFANSSSLDGDVASAAHLGVTGSEAGNIWVFHVDAQGELVWERCIGSSLGLSEQNRDVVKTDEGKFLLVGDMTWFTEDSSGDIHCTNNALIPNSKTNIYVLQVSDTYNYGVCNYYGIDSIGYPCEVIGRTFDTLGQVTHQYASEFSFNEDGQLIRFTFPSRNLSRTYWFADYPLRPSRIFTYYPNFYPTEEENTIFWYQNEKIKRKNTTWYWMWGDFDDVYTYDENEKLIQLDIVEDGTDHYHHYYSYADDYRTQIDSYYYGTSFLLRVTTNHYNERLQLISSLVDDRYTGTTEKHYSYTSHNKIQEIVTQTLTDSVWINTEIVRYVYDENDRVVERQSGSWSSDNADWVITKKTYYDYDDEAMKLLISFKKKRNDDWVWDTYSNQPLLYDTELDLWETALENYGARASFYGSLNINQFEMTLHYAPVQVEFPRWSEWYYKIQQDDGGYTYQHLEYTTDTTINNDRTKIVVRTNQIYDKDGQVEVSHEYIREQDNKVYWWNKELQEFTLLYDYLATPGDGWEIKVGTESIMVHVDDVEIIEFQGENRKVLRISDTDGVFNGDIVVGYGHLTSFFPEKLMQHNTDYQIDGLRCYWVEDALLYHQGDEDCDAVYQVFHSLPETTSSSPVFTLSPNPVHDGTLTLHPHSAFRINSVEGFAVPHYTITSPLGQPVQSGSLSTIPCQIDVTALPAGLYFITIGSQTLKFFKQ